MCLNSPVENGQMTVEPWTERDQKLFIVDVPQNGTASCSSHSPSGPYVVLHLGLCFLFAQKECPPLEDCAVDFVRRRPAERVISP